MTAGIECYTHFLETALAGESPAVSVTRVGHLVMPHPGMGNHPGYAWCKRPGRPKRISGYYQYQKYPFSFPNHAFPSNEHKFSIPENLIMLHRLSLMTKVLQKSSYDLLW